MIRIRSNSPLRDVDLTQLYQVCSNALPSPRLAMSDDAAAEVAAAWDPSTAVALGVGAIGAASYLMRRRGWLTELRGDSPGDTATQSPAGDGGQVTHLPLHVARAVRCSVRTSPPTARANSPCI
jgi:hypothetical protein